MHCDAQVGCRIVGYTYLIPQYPTLNLGTSLNVYVFVLVWGFVCFVYVFFCFVFVVCLFFYFVEKQSTTSAFGKFFHLCQL